MTKPSKSLGAFASVDAVVPEYFGVRIRQSTPHRRPCGSSRGAVPASVTGALAIAIMACCLTRPADATLSVGNFTFESIPGLFGLPWRPDAQYRAHVQFLPDNPFLCDYPTSRLQNETTEAETTSTSSSSGLVAPMDGVPVALLAQRGNCSFGQKAQVAMAYSSSRARIQFCIVYDDEPRTNLIAMQAVDYASMTANIHTLFVSLVTGLQLRVMIQDQANSNSDKHHNGLLIRMNADSPLTPYYYNEGQQWLVAAMAGFFGFIAFFGCLLVAVHTGYIPMEGTRIYYLGGGHRNASIRIPGGRQLLTTDQVAQLNQVQHDADAQDEDSHIGEPCCSICMEDYEHGESLIELPCSHRFHKDCIEPWLTERHPTCPLCKLDMLGHLANLRNNSRTSTNDTDDDLQVCRYTNGAALITRWIRMGWTPVATTTTENIEGSGGEGGTTSISSTTTSNSENEEHQQEQEISDPSPIRTVASGDGEDSTAAASS